MSASVALPTVVSANESYNNFGEVSVETQESNNLKEGNTVVTFTNEEVFEAFEAQGIDVDEVLTNAQTSEAISNQDGMITPQGLFGFTGENKIVERSGGGYDIYINGAIATLAISAGVGAATSALASVSAIATFLSAHGITSGALSGVVGAFSGAAIDSLKEGVIVHTNSYLVPNGFSYQ